MTHMRPCDFWWASTCAAVMWNWALCFTLSALDHSERERERERERGREGERKRERVKGRRMDERGEEVVISQQNHSG